MLRRQSDCAHPVSKLRFGAIEDKHKKPRQNVWPTTNKEPYCYYIIRMSGGSPSLFGYKCNNLWYTLSKNYVTVKFEISKIALRMPITILRLFIILYFRNREKPLLETPPSKITPRTSRLFGGRTRSPCGHFYICDWICTFNHQPPRYWCRSAGYRGLSWCLYIMGAYIVGRYLCSRPMLALKSPRTVFVSVCADFRISWFSFSLHNSWLGSFSRRKTKEFRF